jgi:hypothetical protein
MSSPQPTNHPFHHRHPLWLYHELAQHQWKRPEHLNLCLETVRKHCGRKFRVIPLTRYNIYKYVPDLRKDIWHTCTHRQRMDWMKWELLSRYGGLFLDADVLVVCDLTPHMHKLQDHDFVAFGRTEDGSSPQQPKPLTWAMASRPNGQLVTLARQRCNWILDNKRSAVLQDDTNSTFLFGTRMLWDCMAILRRTNTSQHSWKHFHVTSVCAGSDARNHPYTVDRLLMNETVDEQCLRTMHLLPLGPTSAFPSWFVNASREQLLGNGNLLVSKLWRWSLLDETPFAENDAVQVGREMPTVSVPRFWVSGWVS